MKETVLVVGFLGALFVIVVLGMNLGYLQNKFTNVDLSPSETAPSIGESQDRRASEIESEYEASLKLVEIEDGVYDLVLSSVEDTISAISIRVVPESMGAVIAEPEIIKNLNLIREGWNYPITQVQTVDGATAVEIALVNLNPEGFELEEDLVLATIDFPAQLSTAGLELSFDSELTKVITKKGEEVMLMTND